LTTAVIGATGTLGRKLMQAPDTIACPIRFENANHYHAWFEENNDVDTVWHVARACRKNGVRRDFDTFMLEQNAMLKLLATRVKDCRFVYASTKVVYGVTSNEITPISASVTAENFTDSKTGTVNFPEWKGNKEVNTSNLGHGHLIYAMTKLACEQYIRERCSNYKIIRIWDIA
jgi:nucleoside-diphosphate-sugar epimerase